MFKNAVSILSLLGDCFSFMGQESLWTNPTINKIVKLNETEGKPGSLGGICLGVRTCETQQWAQNKENKEVNIIDPNPNNSYKTKKKFAGSYTEVNPLGDQDNHSSFGSLRSLTIPKPACFAPAFFFACVRK